MECEAPQVPDEGLVVTAPGVSPPQVLSLRLEICPVHPSMIVVGTGLAAGVVFWAS